MILMADGSNVRFSAALCDRFGSPGRGTRLCIPDAGAVSGRLAALLTLRRCWDRVVSAQRRELNLDTRPASRW